MKKIIAALASCVLIIACSPRLIKPTLTDETRGKNLYADVSLASLEKGHELYIAKCGSCHKLHKPDSESEAEWRKILPVMARKAKLDPRQYELIERYVFTMKDAGKESK